MRELTLILLGLSATSGGAAAQEYEFMEFQGHAHIAETKSVAVGDVTGDGRSDVVLVVSPAPATNSVWVYKQLNDGTLSEPIEQPFYSGNLSEINAKLADLNGDGMQDVVIGHGVGISVLLAKGDGSFFFNDFPDLPAITNFALADFDQDRIIDIVCQGESAHILYGNGSGGFARTELLNIENSEYKDLQAKDVTGDGRPDLVFVAHQLLSVYPQAADGSFGAGQAYPNGGIYYPRSLAIGDFDSDGLNDISVPFPRNTPEARILFYGQGVSGALEELPSLESYDIPETVGVADLNRDGRDDLLVLHGGWSAVGRYIQNGAGLLPERRGYVPYTSHYGKTAVAAGDIDGDGCTDVAVANGYQLVTLKGRNCYEPWAMANRYGGDFDGDGRTDILWRHKANGRNVVWKGGNSANPLSLLTVARAWQIAGIGDFDADGRSDIVWRHSITGANTIWKAANSGNLQSMTGITDLNWQIVGIGDFDGDSRSDVLWRHKFSGQNAIWKAGRFDNQMPTIALSPNWRTAGVGDFDGDGRADVLWRNSVNGQNVLWKAGNHLTPRSLTAVNDLYWQVAGIGDFDADSRADILWRHSITGAGTIWKAANSSSQRSITGITTMVWNIAGVGDFDGNGRSDILWRNRRTGVNTIWKSADSTTQQPVGTLSDMSWEIAR